MAGRPERTRRGLILLLFLLSGFSGLAYELIWTKQLSLIFGVTSGAITTVLAAFMGGLALGSALLGARADRSRRPLLFYGALELGIGATAFLLPYLFEAVNLVYVGLARWLPGHTPAFVVLRYLLCFVALLVPTTLMGGTLPAMSRFWVRERDRIGSGVGLLYGVNTIGGVLGTIAAGFLLLGTLGVALTTRVAVALNLLIGFVCIWLARQAPESPPEPKAERRPFGRLPSATLRASRVAPTATGRDTPSGVEGRPRATRRAAAHAPAWLLLVSYGVAGATSLAYEVLWTRVLIYFTGQTIYAFSTILACFLIGLALGSLALARPADRAKDRLVIFALLELAIGLSACYLLLIVGKLLPLATATQRHFSGAGEALPRFVVAFALMLVPTLLMGAVTPLLVRAYVSEVERLGKRLGSLYAANTVGCVLGSVAAGFALLPLLGAQRGVLAVAAVNVALGLLVLAWGQWRRPAKTLVGAVAIAALCVGIAVSRHPKAPIMYWSDAMHLQLDLLYYHEGSEASLAVLANPAGRRELNLNGDTTAAADYDDVVVHKMLAHVPMLLAQHPRKALVIGFGLGSTAWAISRYPLERVDCVELVAAEQQSAKYFASENKGILSEPRFHFLTQDGRNFLLTTNQRYDVISFNAINPSFSPYLYTQEFYQLCRSRLSPGGVVCAWVPTNMGRFPTLAATFRSVFPHVTLWFCNPFHAVLIATPGPLEIDLAEWTARLAQPEVKSDLAEVQLDDPVRLLSTLLLDEKSLASYSDSMAINRDDLPLVEFDTEVNPQIGLQNLGRMLGMRARPWEHVQGAAAGQARAALERYWGEFPAFAAAWGRTFSPHAFSEAITGYNEAVAQSPGDARVRYLRAMAMARLWIADPERSATPAARREAISLLEAGLQPDEMPAERFAARLRAVLGILYVQEGKMATAREQARLMHRTSPLALEQEMLLEAIGEAR
jgi:spermidine synthase